ncbi:sensor histidine kinase [Saccharothrix saharensis]|uniref:sensor histidine kinase n=1 Tax=Saccharothrix saharensis TaxID=571190 RepID=UPI0036B7BE3E
MGAWSWLATDMGRRLSRGPGGSGDATRAMGRVLSRCAAAVRGSGAVVGGVSALLGFGPPADWRWVVPAVLVNLGWSAVFVAVTLRRGLLTWVMAVDLVAVCGLCLIQSHVVSAAALPGGAAWVSVIVSMCVVYGHLAWRPAIAVPTGLAVVACYVAGQVLAGVPGAGLAQASVITLQNLSTLGLMLLLRRVSRTADVELDKASRTLVQARAREAQRAEEREANRRLHDTVLATLTMVGSGSIEASSARLRDQARADLGVVLAMAGGFGGYSGLVRLDELLPDVAERASAPVVLALSLARCEVPGPVADSFLWAGSAALANVRRHARVGRAEVRLDNVGDAVVLTVVDRGRGFDPDAVPPHRYGLREGIVGRMAAVGGMASVDSRPGVGTRITLRWCADG